MRPRSQRNVERRASPSIFEGLEPIQSVQRPIEEEEEVAPEQPTNGIDYEDLPLIAGVIDLTSRDVEIQTDPTQSDAAIQAEPTRIDVEIQAEPSQNFFGQLASSLKLTYLRFLQLEQHDRLYNSSFNCPTSQSFQHCQVMAKIDYHFTRNQDAIEPAIIEYLSSNVNVQELNTFDKIRTSLMNLEIQRVQVEMERKRLQQNELSNAADQRQMVCFVCYRHIEPGMHLLFGKCGHLTCADCLKQVFAARNLHNRCSVCTVPIPSINDALRCLFKFNAKKHAVCRFCLKPFNENVGDITMISCGHAYHAACMRTNGQCMECGCAYDRAKLTRVFAYWMST